MEEKAGEWFARREFGLSPAEQAEFDCWVSLDPRHATLMREFDETWSRMASAPGGETAPSLPCRPRRAWWLGGLAAAVTLMLAGMAAWQWPAVEPTAEAAQRFITTVGELRQVSLPDGSTLQLNTDSVVDVAFLQRERRLTLAQGEARFEVERDTTRPFLVAVGGIEIRALGTAFDIRRRADSVSVLLTAGRVQVRNGNGSSPPIVLDPGQRLTVSIAPSGEATGAFTITTLNTEELRRLAGWRNRSLEFVAQPLREMVAEFNRYNRHQLIIADEQLAGQRFGGGFAPGDYAALVQMLETYFGVLAERRGDETMLRLASPAVGRTDRGTADGRTP